MPAFNQAFADPSKAKSAIEEFERENPTGSGRKKLIDWVQWKRTHGVVQSYKLRDSETLMGIDDFYALRSFPRGKTREASDAEFQQLAKQNYDREGEGANLQLWLPDPKKRMRDITHFSKSEVEESSKAMKDVSKKEKEELMDACLTSNLDHGSKFLRQVTGQTAKPQVKKEVKTEAESDGEEAQTAKARGKGGRRNRVNLADEAPKQYGKLQKEIPVLSRSMEQAIDKVVASIQSKVESVDAGCGRDAELSAYAKTAEVRLKLGRLWCAQDVPAAEAALKSALRIMGAAAQTTSSPAKAAAAPDGATDDIKKDKAKDSGDGGKGEKNNDKVDPDDKDKGHGHGQDKDGSIEIEKGDNQENQAKEKTEKSQSEQKDTSSVAASSPSKPSSKSVGQQIADMLQKAFKAMGEAAMVVQQPKLLMPIALFEEEIESILQAKTVKELDDTITRIRQSSQQAKLLAGSITKSATNLGTHVQNLKRRKVREEAKRKKEDETKELLKVRAAAKAAAKKVKDEEHTVPELFTIDLEQIENEKIMEPIPVKTATTDDFDQNLPCKFKDIPQIQDWMKVPKIQLCMSNFGGKYKKSDTYSASGRTQSPIYNREGREETLELLQKVIMSKLEGDLSKEEHAFSKVFQTPWLYGYSPSMASVTPTPNNTGMIKILAQGSVKFFAMEPTSLVDALRKVFNNETISIDELPKLVSSLTVTLLKECKEAGLKMFYAVQEPNEMLWIPTGYICCEQSVKGVLVYGLRMSMLIRSLAASSQYETMMGLCAAAKKDTQTMSKVLQLINPDQE